MIGRMTFWYSYALNFPRRRSADFQISLARLSSLGLLSERAIEGFGPFSLKRNRLVKTSTSEAFAW